MLQGNPLHLNQLPQVVGTQSSSAGQQLMNNDYKVVVTKESAHDQDSGDGIVGYTEVREDIKNYTINSMPPQSGGTNMVVLTLPHLRRDMELNTSSANGDGAFVTIPMELKNWVLAEISGAFGFVPPDISEGDFYANGASFQLMRFRPSTNGTHGVGYIKFYGGGGQTVPYASSLPNTPNYSQQMVCDGGEVLWLEVNGISASSVNPRGLSVTLVFKKPASPTPTPV